MKSRQTLRIVLSAVIGLLVVPVAVNIGTGGNAPDWLRPYINWLWPVAVACVLVVIALELWDRREPNGTLSVQFPNDPRNVDLALKQVARYIAARQRGTLVEQVRVALSLDERPESVRQPTHLVQRVSGDEFQLSADLTIADVFQQMNESMLILGAPGAGKTTQLLDLAAALIDQARSARDPAVPVVVDLADWSAFLRGGPARRRASPQDKYAFDAWLVAYLDERYKIPPGVGRRWLAENRLMLLLDGLDEVAEPDRDQCAAEINGLQRRHGITRVAVCSREADYAALHTRLRLQGAVVIRPLTRETVQAYLESVSPALAGVVAALQADEELWSLLTTPLMLTIMILAGVDEGSGALASIDDPAARRRQLFDAYVVEVMARRRTHERADTERDLRGIQLLATASTQRDWGVLVPPFDASFADQHLPDRVKGVSVVWVAAVCVIMAGAAWTAATMFQFGPAVAAIPAVLGVLGLSFMLSYSAPIRDPWAFLRYLLTLTIVSAGLGVGVLDLLSASVRTITVTGVVGVLAATAAVLAAGARSTPTTAKSTMRDQFLFFGVGAGAAIGVVLIGLRPRLIEGWTLGMVPGALFMAGLLFTVGFQLTAEREAVPRSASITRWCMAVAYAAACAAALLTISPRSSGAFWEPAAGLLLGLLYAALTATMAVVGGLGDLAFRQAIVIAGEPYPWSRSFLRFAADRSLLTRTDGQYRFLHLLVRDHLAECDPAQLAEAVVRRRTELLQRRAPVPAH